MPMFFQLFGACCSPETAPQRRFAVETHAGRLIATRRGVLAGIEALDVEDLAKTWGVE